MKTKGASKQKRAGENVVLSTWLIAYLPRAVYSYIEFGLALGFFHFVSCSLHALDQLWPQTSSSSST
jgi:hypothetical protein